MANSIIYLFIGSPFFSASLLCPLFFLCDHTPKNIFIHLTNKTLSQDQFYGELGNIPVSTKSGPRQ